MIKKIICYRVISRDLKGRRDLIAKSDDAHVIVGEFRDVATGELVVDPVV